jgi:hypothetical protein
MKIVATLIAAFANMIHHQSAVDIIGNVPKAKTVKQWR